MTVAPVRQATRLGRSNRWSATARDDEFARVPRLESIPSGRRRRLDGVLGVLVVAAIGLAMVKPWGDQPRLGDALPAPPPPAGPSALSLGPIAIPPTAFAPAPAACMSDMGWRACALDGSGEQTIRSMYQPVAAAAAAGLEAPVSPAVVLVTKAGAALAFYAPPGFYASSHRHADGAGGEPAWGPVAVSAWWVDPVADSTLSIDLRAIGSLGNGTQVAGNAFVPPADPLLNAERWPSGRYIVWLNGGGAQPWDAFFYFQILPPPPTRSKGGLATAAEDRSEESARGPAMVIR